MTWFRRRAALYAAVDSAARNYLCESLERRVMLDANDPVIVVVEPVQNFVVPQVVPYLWTSPVETPLNPRVGGNPAPDGVDRDGNDYPDDAFGWNFHSNPPSPVWAIPNSGNGHGSLVSQAVVNTLDTVKQNSVACNFRIG